MYGGFNFSCDVLGLLEIEGWVWVCVLCVLNLIRFLYFVDLCALILRVPCWHVLDFFNFLGSQTYYLRKNINMFFMMTGKNIM